MKKILMLLIGVLFATSAIAQESDTLSINEITVVSFYRNSNDTGSVVDKKELIELLNKVYDEMESENK